MGHGATREEQLGRVAAMLRHHIDEAERLAGVGMNLCMEALAEGSTIDWLTVKDTMDTRLARLRAGRGTPAAGADGAIGDDSAGVAVQLGAVASQPNGPDLDVMGHDA